MANKVKEIWASGKGSGERLACDFRRAFSAESDRAMRFSTASTVDMQARRGRSNQSMMQCFQAMHGHPVTADGGGWPWNEPGIIGKVLDGRPPMA